MEIFTLFVIIFLILLIPTAYAGFIGAPYAPTFSPAIKQAFDFVKLGPADTLVDLGAGDGRVLLAAARRGASALGYELSPIMWAVVFFRALRHKKVRIKLRNFYQQTLPPSATVIFAFLMPKNMPKVRRYLSKQALPNGKFFLVYAFPLSPDTKPLHVIRVPRCAPLYIYDIKALVK